MTLKEMMGYYIRHQEDVITRRTKFDLQKALDREHILEGMKLVVDHTDEVIQLIRHSADTPTAKTNLMERFSITDVQANAIVTMQLGRLSGMERIKIEEELGTVQKRIRELEEILASEGRILEIVKNELREVGEKYEDPRRTQIQMVSGEVDIEDLIPEESNVITLTHFGYIKRQSMDLYRSQHRGGRGVSGMNQRDEDFVEELFVCSTHDYVLFFTNRGKVFRLKGFEIAEGSRNARGMNIVNLLPLESEEKVTSMIKVSDYDDTSYLCMLTKKGILKRTTLSSYSNIRKSGLIAINLDEGDRLCTVRLTSGNDELLVATRGGRAIRFHEEDARAIGRTARGVRAIELEGEDETVGMIVVDPEKKFLTVSEAGFGRRTPFDDFRRQTRGGKGVSNLDVEKRGLVAGILQVEDDDDVIMISSDGIIIRMPVSDIAVQSRHGSGVRVMRLQEDSYLVTIAGAQKEQDEEDGEEEPEDLTEDRSAEPEEE